MQDRSAEVIAQFTPQFDALMKAVPGLLALGPNMGQLIAMGRAMFQQAATLPAGPVQVSYRQAMQQLADVIKANRDA